jgi:hypothetical protein
MAPRWRVPAQPGHHQVRRGFEEIGIVGVRDGFGAEVSAMAECLELAAPEPPAGPLFDPMSRAGKHDPPRKHLVHDWC